MNQKVWAWNTTKHKSISSCVYGVGATRGGRAFSTKHRQVWLRRPCGSNYWSNNPNIVFISYSCNLDCNKKNTENSSNYWYSNYINFEGSFCKFLLVTTRLIIYLRHGLEHTPIRETAISNWYNWSTRALNKGNREVGDKRNSIIWRTY